MAQDAALSAPRHVRFTEALLKGFSLARKAPRVVGLGVLSDVVDGAMAFAALTTVGALGLVAVHDTLSGVPPTLLLQYPQLAAGATVGAFLHEKALRPIIGAAVCGGFVVMVLRLLWISAAARSFARSFAGEPLGQTALADGASRFDRGVITAALLAPLEIGSFLWATAALGSAGFAFVDQLHSRHGLFRAAMLALAITLSIALRGAVGFIGRLAILRAVGADEGPVDAIAGAARTLVARLGPLLAVLVLFTALEGAASLVSESGGVFALGRGKAALLVAFGFRGVTGLLGSLLIAFLSTAELGAFATLDAGERGALPEPPQPPPAILVTEPLVTTEAVLPTEEILPTGPAQ